MNHDASCAMTRTVHICDVWESSEHLSNNAPPDSGGHAAHTEHCGSICIAVETLSDTHDAVKNGMVGAGVLIVPFFANPSCRQVPFAGKTESSRSLKRKFSPVTPPLLSSSGSSQKENRENYRSYQRN